MSRPAPTLFFKNGIFSTTRAGTAEIYRIGYYDGKWNQKFFQEGVKMTFALNGYLQVLGGLKFDNGVRTGNIPDHKATAKTHGIGQSWFPSNWTKKDIDTAAKYVIQQNQSIYNSLADGVPLFDIYNGVRVGLLKTDGQFATIFPDNKFQPYSAGQLILNPKF